jgi:hypothetical protein
MLTWRPHNLRLVDLGRKNLEFASIFGSETLDNGAHRAARPMPRAHGESSHRQERAARADAHYVAARGK